MDSTRFELACLDSDPESNLSRDCTVPQGMLYGNSTKLPYYVPRFDKQ